MACSVVFFMWLGSGVWGQDHQWLDVELLKPGPEASEAGASPSASVTLPQQTPNTKRNPVWQEGERKAVKVKFAICERRKLKMCSPAHANHPWPLGCTCNRTQHTAPPSPVPTQSAAEIDRGGRNSVPSVVGRPWYPSSSWRASDLPRAAGFTGRLLSMTLLKRTSQPPSAPTPRLLTSCLPPVGICLSLRLLLEIPHFPPHSLLPHKKFHRKLSFRPKSHHCLSAWPPAAGHLLT